MDTKTKKKKNNFILNYIREPIAIKVMYRIQPLGLKERIKRKFGLSDKSASFWIYTATKTTRRRYNRLKVSPKIKRMAAITQIEEGAIIDKILKGKIKLEKRDAFIYLMGIADGIESCGVDNSILRRIVDEINSRSLKSKNFWKLLPSVKKTSENGG
jgi:hypothetical protein